MTNHADFATFCDLYAGEQSQKLNLNMDTGMIHVVIRSIKKSRITMKRQPGSFLSVMMIRKTSQRMCA